MDPGDAFLAVIALSVSCTLALTCGIGWFRATRRVRELERQLSRADPDSTVADLEASLAVLSAHVEQIADGQDFLSRMLTNPKPARQIQSEATPR